METLLTLDRGNSTLDVMWHGDPRDRRRLSPDDWAGLASLLDAYEVQAVAGLSVVPGGLAAVEDRLTARGIAMRLAGRDLRCPLELAYDDPATLGVDRWVGAFAAHRLYGAAVVVDCGTAVTVNLVDRDGVFRGGAIAPGPQTMAASLRRAAPALPAVDLDRDWRLPAVDSQAAVDAGVQLGFCGAVDRLLDASTVGLAQPWTLVLTGGLAGVYARHGAREFASQPDLIHQGLRWLDETRASNC